MLTVWRVTLETHDIVPELPLRFVRRVAAEEDCEDEAVAVAEIKLERRLGLWRGGARSEVEWQCVRAERLREPAGVGELLERIRHADQGYGEFRIKSQERIDALEWLLIIGAVRREEHFSEKEMQKMCDYPERGSNMRGTVYLHAVESESFP